MPRNWHDFSVGHPGYYVSLSIDSRDEELTCKLYLGGAKARSVFAELKKDQSTIEHTLGGELEWDDRPDRQRCQIVQRRSADLYDEPSWPDLFAWCVERIEAFRECFRSRLDALAKASSTDHLR